MPSPLASIALPLLRRLDPERAHNLAVLGLRLGLGGRSPADAAGPALSVEALGRVFPNPIGLAAGFDKDALALRQLRRLGFGFIEAGTVTPRPQAGNPRPRVFRLEANRAVINRYGLNSRGLDPFAARLAALPRGHAPGYVPGRVPIGANVGINKQRADPERDLPTLVATVAPHSDYVAINVSSPNTPGLRDLQDQAHLARILDAIRARMPRDSGLPPPPPLLVKIAPDLPDGWLEGLVETAVAGGAAGLIVSNTTVARPKGLRGPHARKAGGLSGPPLFAASTELLRQAHRLARGRLVLVGCGGVSSGADVLAKVRAGAHLVQLYTAFAYEGPALLPRLLAELRAAMLAQGFARITDAIGVDA